MAKPRSMCSFLQPTWVIGFSTNENYTTTPKEFMGQSSERIRQPTQSQAHSVPSLNPYTRGVGLYITKVRHCSTKFNPAAYYSPTIRTPGNSLSRYQRQRLYSFAQWMTGRHDPVAGVTPKWSVITRWKWSIIRLYASRAQTTNLLSRTPQDPSPGPRKKKNKTSFENSER